MKATSVFEVTGHHELPDRGAFVLGHITAAVSPGMLVRGTGSSRSFPVSGVEFLSGKGNHINALVFVGKPSLAEILEAFPVGSNILPEPGGSGGAP
jgi:hypothetical protein